MDLHLLSIHISSYQIWAHSKDMAFACILELQNCYSYQFYWAYQIKIFLYLDNYFMVWQYIFFLSYVFWIFYVNRLGLSKFLDRSHNPFLNKFIVYFIKMHFHVIKINGEFIFSCDLRYVGNVIDSNWLRQCSNFFDRKQLICP